MKHENILMRVTIIMFACLAVAEPIEITEFTNGYLTFSTPDSNFFYHVQYKPNLTESLDWDGTYNRLKNIQPTGLLARVAIGRFFRVLGTDEPVEIGTAQARDILQGKTFFVQGEKWEGTMPNVSSQSLVPGTNDQTILNGYHDGNGVVYGDTNLVPENIRNDVTIFGVNGDYIRAAVPKTGRTNMVVTGDDGDLQEGMSWPTPRFADHQDGTVTDTLTKLMWVKAPHDLTGNEYTLIWIEAVDFCNELNYADYADWRLPNVRELSSLIDYGRSNPALPLDHPFDVYPSHYWTSTLQATSLSTNAYDKAWKVNLQRGFVFEEFLVNDYVYALPVRGGKK